MSVPTNNLYNFVAQALENKYLVKHFHPWGHKGFANVIDNIEDARPNVKSRDIPVLLCHDQEPLDFELYNDTNLVKQLDTFYPVLRKMIQSLLDKGISNLNLRWVQPNWHRFEKRLDQPYWTLLHSELNSPEVLKYESTGLFKCAYWWAHAPIAVDWYRFARYDTRLIRRSQDLVANFLVYARDTTGKRAYRNKFLEHLAHIDNVQLGSIDTNLIPPITRCNEGNAENDADYNPYQEDISSSSSATYSWEDFARTNCSIVLETVYDQRIHLTEKTLRPLACGHPFMILNGPGALEKIREYGFKTFQPYINESYDKETDPVKRMDMVLTEMNRINSSSEKYQKWIWDGCQQIAEHNKRLFFHDKFIWRVKTELRKTVRTV
jgi:hypothetical protein